MLLLAGAAPAWASQTQAASSQTLPPSASARSATSSSAPKPPSTAQPTAKKKKKSASAARKQLAPDPARIREIQQALAREGYYTGDPSGKWDEQTVTAMKGFQQTRGLAPTGKIEALSLQKLGLGSATSGVAPPEPKSPTEPRTPASATPSAASPSRP